MLTADNVTPEVSVIVGMSDSIGVEQEMGSVDVAIPCYQYGRYIRSCVTSVLSQDIKDLRILIIDNASTDNSVEMAQQLATEDSRVELVAHAKNLGANASYNEGIDWAIADYFLLLDADDLLPPGALGRAVAVLDERPDIAFTFGKQILAGSEVEPKASHFGDHSNTWQVCSGLAFIRHLCRTGANPVGASTVLRRTSIQKQAGYYRPELPYTDDMELWLRLACLGNVAKTSAAQAIRRKHPKQHSSHYESIFIRDFHERDKAFKSFFANEGRQLPRASELEEQASRSLGDHAYWSAVSHIVRGQVDLGAELFRYASDRRGGLAPLPPIAWLFRTERASDRAKELLAAYIRRLVAA
jgi:GT2 family glycosyltransferase